MCEYTRDTKRTRVAVKRLKPVSYTHLSVLETKKIREQSGEDFIIINPGIRLAEDSKGDQKRVARCV